MITTDTTPAATLTPKDPAAVSLGTRGGKVGGLAKSPAKTAAAKANGAKGGRPRKPVAGVAGPTPELIAAAPDLLAALAEFSARIWGDCRLPGEMRDELKCFYHNVVRPAIAKAEGAK